MSLVPDQGPGGFEKLAELEASLLGRIEASADELRHIECLDEEQRAEIHAILEAMKHDGLSHVAVIQSLAGGSAQEACHA